MNVPFFHRNLMQAGAFPAFVCSEHVGHEKGPLYLGWWRAALFDVDKENKLWN